MLCGVSREESAFILQDCREIVADYSRRDLKPYRFPNDRELLNAIRGGIAIHLLYYNFTGGQSLNSLRRFREKSDHAALMLITNASVSPMEYLRPGVLPDALFMRPFQKEAFREINREFILSFLSGQETPNVSLSFPLNLRGERVMIPYAKIYLFEAREKKIFVRTENREYACYDTMEALEARLPVAFLRCHRSFIVNANKVLRVAFSERCLELPGRIVAPISRNYMALVRETFS